MSGTKKLAIFETHPIQYRAPVYQALEKIVGNQFEVVYASNFSIRGYRDDGFGNHVAWDKELLSGYPMRILHAERLGGIQRFRGLSKTGVSATLYELKPRAILLNSFGYEFCIATYLQALRKRIPIWLRCETQDIAFSRSRLKTAARYASYRALYSPIRRFFAIGNLNYDHYINHGVSPDRIRYARYCTPDPISGIDNESKMSRRRNLRTKLGVLPEQIVITFIGKLIPKKDPEILFKMLQHLTPEFRSKIFLLFVGDGEMMDHLQGCSSKFICNKWFAGFVGQSEIGDYYLASDILVLPSRQMGETWGLVVNEALNAGCSVITSDRVGCSKDFNKLERFRTFVSGDAIALSKAVIDLAAQHRDFNWARDFMATYSIDAAANAIATEMAKLR